MNKKVFLSAVLAVSITAGAVCGAYAYSVHNKSRVMVHKVEFIKGKKRDNPYMDYADDYGEIVGRSSIVVSLDEDKPLKSICVNEGDKVTAGTLLAEYEPGEALAEKEICEIELQIAQLSLRKKEIELNQNGISISAGVETEASNLTGAADDWTEDSEFLFEEETLTGTDPAESYFDEDGPSADDETHQVLTYEDDMDNQNFFCTGDVGDNAIIEDDWATEDADNLDVFDMELPEENTDNAADGR